MLSLINFGHIHTLDKYFINSTIDVLIRTMGARYKFANRTDWYCSKPAHALHHVIVSALSQHRCLYARDIMFNAIYMTRAVFKPTYYHHSAMIIAADRGLCDFLFYRQLMTFA